MGSPGPDLAEKENDDDSDDSHPLRPFGLNLRRFAGEGARATQISRSTPILSV